jgi:glycosyltransferase involved in cell wall biosynthesis
MQPSALHPTLSVLLPVFNGATYVESTIESVLSQSYSDFELLVLDDGSQDATPQILERCARRDPRLRIFRHENHGVGYTLQRGLSECGGRYVALIGADDLALPGRFEKQVSFLETNPDYVFVGGYLQIIDTGGRVIGLRRYPATDRNLRRTMLLYNPFGAPAAMFRREDALAAGGFTSRFWTCEDYDFFLRLAKRGKVANLTEALVSYRLHSNAVKATQTLRQLRDTLATKRAAYTEYGYRPSLIARVTDLALAVMTWLPPAFTYRLFTRVAIRGRRT